MPPRAVYIHVPFCSQRCGYCNFTLVARRDDLIDRYLDTLAVELSWLGDEFDVDTLFFGGGTPSHLSPTQLDRLCQIVRRHFPRRTGQEFSVEANPNDIDPQRVAVLAAHGVIRISLGVQSFQAAKLQQLDREHRADQIYRAVDLCRAFRSVAIDLIFAAPGETLIGWADDLKQALLLNIDHVSTYGLTFEKGTAFWSRRMVGEIHGLPEELESQMYAAAIDTLTAGGFEHYEVSNFARPGHRCRHNDTYWLGEEYFAAGPGAARYVGGRREVNHRSTTTYLQRVMAGDSPVAECETLSPEDAARELFVFAMRRLEGVSRSWFTARSGFSIEQLAGPELAKSTDQGLLADDGEIVKLTRRGLFVSDALWPRFLRH